MNTVSAATAPPRPAPADGDGLPRLLPAAGVPAGLAAHLGRHGPVPYRGAPRALIPDVRASGLTGRGGAAFPTYRKLEAVAAARPGRAVVVGNAAEGEPASRKDEALLTLAPHLVLDGLQLAAEAVGAGRAILYVRHDVLRRTRIETQILERPATGLDRVAVEVMAAPGRFQAGEESALSSLVGGGTPVRSLDATYRLTAVRGAGGQVLLTGLPTAPMTDTLNSVELTEVVVFAAALLLTALFGTGWVRLSLRPLRRVTATAGQVARLPLASQVELPHRVPDADPRTEVGQLGAAFNRMLGHVESALARREASESRLRRFAADASHELRTPLAAIRGYAELARRRPDKLRPEVEHALGRVEAEAARMSALVEDLLLLARLDAGRPLESAPVDLTRLAIDATSDARAAGPGHRWRLELPEGPVPVPGDDQRLRQVLANLLSNARTHTPAGTTVTVAVALGRSPAGDAPLAELSVTDDGPGIPAELQPDLFERFVRGDSSRSRAAGSTGLGLSIVAAVIAAHRGTASVTSEPGRTRFLITLPLDVGPPGPDPKHAPAS
jgi:two-component system, OmpR family, sensor kinase